MYCILTGDPKPIQYIKGVGPARAKAFNKVGIVTDIDLLYYLPRDYVNRTSILTVKQIHTRLLKDNFFVAEINYELKEEVTLLCKVVDKKIKTTKGQRKFLVVNVKDYNGDEASLIFWQYPEYFEKIFERGQFYIVYGTPELDYQREVTFHHPEVERFDRLEETEFLKGTTLPIYPMSTPLRAAKINNKLLRKIILEIINSALEKIDDYLPEEALHKFQLKSLKYTLKNIHFPEDLNEVPKLRERFKFDEAFIFELMLANYRTKQLDINPAPEFKKTNNLIRQFLTGLPFELTNDQKKVIAQIFSDLKSGKPMNRLLQGDVGSGKTIVAIFAMLLAKVNNFQSAIMAPTEILAEQHFLTISNLLSNYPINIELVVGSQSTKERKEISEKIKSGKIDIIVGTHALFEGTIEFNRLGLVIIDEQHRFGVAQRSKLREVARKSLPNRMVPHFLVMSATPIPRTLAMTLYGDLDVSTIKEMPKGRKSVTTKIVFEEDLSKMYNFIREQLNKGYQAYFVYPLIEKSEKLEIKSATEHWSILQNKIFPEFSCGLLHGRMKSDEKEFVMRNFKEGKYHILVSTTVIEVGIDVPNANIMVIESAERFGLSQLHQLRGRVGRGSAKSYCFLVVSEKFSNKSSLTSSDTWDGKLALSRLKAMEQTTDGFKIAEIDLNLRGPGDILGTQQSGLPPFKFLNLATDGEIISNAKSFALQIKKEDPELTSHTKLKTILQRYAQDKKFFGIG
ncbi:MAG: ATP-dependent DNA helicase RecG [Candidatus Kapaibacteriota bacterium]